MLVSEVDYITLTGDEATATVLVTGALVESQMLIEDELQRLLEEGEYTEVLKVYRNGRVYPSVTPLKSTPPAQPYIIADDTSIYFGWGLDPIINWEGAFTAWSQVDIGFGTVDALYPHPQVEVTYTGGFTSDELPLVLRRAIIRLANALLREQTPRYQQQLQTLPLGATNLSVGDVSVSLATPAAGMSALVPGLSQSIRPYRKRQV